MDPVALPSSKTQHACQIYINCCTVMAWHKPSRSATARNNACATSTKRCSSTGGSTSYSSNKRVLLRAACSASDAPVQSLRQMGLLLLLLLQVLHHCLLVAAGVHVLPVLCD